MVYEKHSKGVDYGNQSTGGISWVAPKDEIKKLERKVTEKGYTLIPLNFYLKNGRVKVSLGVCKGKKQFDKRATIKQRDVNRDIQREFSKELKR